MTRVLYALLAFLTFAAAPAAAQYLWTGAGGGPPNFDPVDWGNRFNWASAAVPMPGSNTSLTFAGTALSNNNLSGTFTLNYVEFDTVTTLGGSPFNFQSNSSGGLPRIAQQSAGPATVTNNLVLSNDFYILYSSTGTVTLAGAVSGAGSLNIGNNSSGNPIAVLSSGSNTYSGGTYVTGMSLRTDATGALPSGGSVNLLDSSLDLNGTNQTIGNLTLRAGGAAPMVQTGSGTLTLDGNVTYSAVIPGPVPAAVISGNLELYSFFGMGFHTFDIGAGGSQTGYDTVITAAISGASGLTKAGAGVLRLTNPANSYSGGTFVTGGTLSFYNPTSLPAGRNVTVQAGILDLNSSYSIGALTLSDTSATGTSPAPTVRNTTGGTLTLGGDVTYAPSSTSPAAVISSGVLDLGSATFRYFNVGAGGSQSGYDVLISAAITGSAKLYKTGAGLLALTYGGNSYGDSNGSTIVEGGTLRTDADGALPAGRNIVIQQGTLDLNGTTQSLGRLDIITDGSAAGSVVQNTSGGRLILGGDVNYTPSSMTPGARFTGGSLDMGGANRAFNIGVGASTYDTVLDTAITGSGGLTKTGNGSLVLLRSSSASYTGPTTVTAGTLYLGKANVLSKAVIVNGGTLSLNPGATQQGVTAGQYNQSFGSLSGSGGTVNVSAATLTVGTDNTNTSYAGYLAGAYDTATGNSGTLVKVGTGALTLSQSGSLYSILNITVSGGVLAVVDDGSLGSAGYYPSFLLTVNPAGTLRYTASANTGRAFDLNGGTLESAAGVTLTLNGATVNGGFLRGAGTFILTAGTALSGATTMTSTTINQIGPASVTNFTNGGAFTVAAGQTLSLNGGTNTSSGRLTLNGTANVSDFVSDGTLTINPGGALNSSAPIVLGGGSRTFIGVSGAPGGTINLNGQTLELDGGLLSNNGTISGTVNVNYGSLAKGTGVYGVVNVSQGGIFAPGNSPGIVTASAVTFDNASTVGGPTLQIEIGGISLGTQYDQLHVTGQLALGGTLDVQLINGFMPTALNSFHILDCNAITGTFRTLHLPALSSGLAWSTSQLYTGGLLSVVSSNLPGDLNSDGRVDAADYVFLRKQYPDITTGAGLTAYQTWRTNFGRTTSGSGASASVPEPAALVLLIISATSICAWPRNSCR